MFETSPITTGGMPPVQKADATDARDGHQSGTPLIVSPSGRLSDGTEAPAPPTPSSQYAGLVAQLETQLLERLREAAPDSTGLVSAPLARLNDVLKDAFPGAPAYDLAKLIRQLAGAPGTPDGETVGEIFLRLLKTLGIAHSPTPVQGDEGQLLRRLLADFSAATPDPHQADLATQLMKALDVVQAGNVLRQMTDQPLLWDAPFPYQNGTSVRIYVDNREHDKTPRSSRCGIRIVTSVTLEGIGPTQVDALIVDRRVTARIQTAGTAQASIAAAHLSDLRNRLATAGFFADSLTAAVGDPHELELPPAIGRTHPPITLVDRHV